MSEDAPEPGEIEATSRQPGCSSVPSINYPGLVYVAAGAIDHPQTVEIPFAPKTPGGPNIMCVYTGTAVCPIQGKANWNRTHMYVQVPTGARAWTFPGDVSQPPEDIRYLLSATAIAAPATLFNKNVANNAGWGVEAAWVETTLSGPVTYLMLGTHIAVSDTDGYLYRVSYQITAVGQEFP